MAQCLSSIRNRGLLALCLLTVLGLGSRAQEAPIVQPGAPGETARELTAEQAIEVADTGHSPADARFMQDMIPHHHQAIEMAALVADRTNRPELLDVAGRIDASQADEIDFMQQWLRNRAERVPDPTEHDAMHTSHTMAGMASPEQMAQLAAAEGTEFDRLFLSLMIAHHEGAVAMVEELLEQPGSAYDPVLYEFTSDVTNDQTAEIERMNALLVGLSPDPRAALDAGFENAGQAIKNLELLASLPKPPGFFDPENPAGLPPQSPEADAADEDADAESEENATGEDERAPLLSFANTDLAFAGDVLVAGNYHGYNIYRLMEDGIPEHVSSIVCPGGQGDVSVVGDLLIMSVEQTRGRLDCGLEGVAEDVSAERFRGIRIFDLSDLERPLQVGAVQTCRGSHTHSVVSGPEPDGKIIVYNSGTSTVRDEDEMEGCFNETPGDDRTALFRIDVIEIPVDDPSAGRRSLTAPRCLLIQKPEYSPAFGAAAIMGTKRKKPTSPTNATTSRCSRRPVLRRAPAPETALSSISPNQRTHNESTPCWTKGSPIGTRRRSTTTVQRSCSPMSGVAAPGRAAERMIHSTGARTAIYDIVDGKLVFRSYFKLPAPQVDQENLCCPQRFDHPDPGARHLCSSLVPGRDFNYRLYGFSKSARNCLLRSGPDPRRTPNPRWLLVRLLVSGVHLRNGDRSWSRHLGPATER